MTYRQLAQLAGVSVSTVSKALSGSREISVETVERIQNLAVENGIKRPRYYRANRMRSVAIIASETTSRFTSQTLSQIAEILWDNSIVPKIYLCSGEYSKYCNAIDAIDRDECVGIISLYEKKRFPHNIDVPILHISYSKLIYGAFSGNNDNCGVAQAVKHLVSLGHTKIGYVGRKDSTYEAEGFKKIIMSHGIEYVPEYVFRNKDYFWKNGDEAADYYLSLPEMPTALISSSDEIAVTSFDSFVKRGIRIPQDISIIGVGNSLCTKCIKNPISSIELSTEQTISMLVKLFLRGLEDYNDNPKTDFVIPQSELVLRGSTAPPKTTSEEGEEKT